MALQLALRNFSKLNCRNILKVQQTIQLNTYTTVTTAVRHQLLNSSKSLVKSVPTLNVDKRCMSAVGSNHTALWTIERVVSLALLGVIPAAFVMPSQTMDAIMAVSLVLHSHWGIEALITDYVRPSIVGNILPKVAHAALILLSMASLGGLFYLIYNDIGIAKSIKKLWMVKAA